MTQEDNFVCGASKGLDVSFYPVHCFCHIVATHWVAILRGELVFDIYPYESSFCKPVKHIVINIRGNGF